MIIDTGSPITIMPLNVYNKYFITEALEPVDNACTRYTSYTKHKIEFVGCLKANFTFNGRSGIGKIHITNNGSVLLGRDMIKVLGIQIDGENLECNNITNLSDNVSTANTVHSRFPTLFDDKTVGLIRGFKHKIKVKPDSIPIQQKLRRLPFAVRDKVSLELKRLEHADIIEKVDASEWISPIVVVSKKSGDIRICVDLRRPNEAIIPDKYPLPNIEELLSELNGAKVFSKIDLKSAYHQVDLHEDSRPLTTFITHDGLYRYKRVCFGLASAPSCFQKMMSMLLGDIHGV
jgi:archaellum component FlaF (FlaF/FlaG flagellin family)